MRRFAQVNKMKPANDTNTDYKALVRQAYDHCAADYDESRYGVAPLEINVLTSRLKKGAIILDIGCGAGVPIARTLAKSFSVTGVDISSSMIARAQSNIPNAKFINGDIMAVTLPPSSFDAAVAFYSIFHIPREEHPALFKRVHGWLKPSGYLLATLSFNDDSSYTDNYLDGTMYWSNYGLETYYNLLAKAGFRSLKTTAIGGGYTDIAISSKERHPLVLAQKV
jgi:ubiquinone/menaquinone biosynthesis C-methylase UbiE